jgi:AraC-like DNA-binding protein/mannose-6-phosphate isomerase-like protein (cupin superfamily)
MIDSILHVAGWTAMPKLLHFDAGFQDLMGEVSGARRKAVTVGIETETAGWELKFHSHQKTQLMLSVRGVGLCEAEGSIWLVPPQSAILIPAKVMHRVAVSGKIEGYAVFIEPIGTQAKPQAPPRKTTTITVTPLLRELIIRSAQFPAKYKPGGVESRVTALLLDEIAAAPTGGLHLPMPSDPRLRRIFEGMIANPANRGDISYWARRAGLGQRTLARVVVAETGMSFGRWRQRLNIILAMQWMAEGATVEKTAIDLGYKNVGSFITMFRKALGASPAHYMAERSENR